jgi:hypothetical protein
MYSVRRNNHPQYGSIIEIVTEENGIYKSPFQVEKQAKKEYRLWILETSKVRFLFDNQIFNINQIERWARDEYKSLPKCHGCAAILDELLFTNSIEQAFFCSQRCADLSYQQQMDRFNDYEECDI